MGKDVGLGFNFIMIAYTIWLLSEKQWNVFKLHNGLSDLVEVK